MAYHSGDAYALIGKEETWGTGVTTDKDVGQVTDLSTTANKNLKKQFGLSSTEIQGLTEGKKEYNGSMTVNFQHGRLLEYALGSVSHDDTDTPDIKHTFTVSDTLPSFTLEDGFNSTSDTVLTYAGCKLSSLRINVPSIDDEVQLNCDFIAKSLSTGTTGSSATLSTLEVLSGAVGTVKLDGTAVDEVQNFEITINRGTSALFGIGDQEAQDLDSRETSFDFTGTIGFSSKDRFDEILASDTFTIEIDADNGTTAGSGKRQLYIKLDGCKFSSVSKTSTIGEYVFVDVSGSGEFNSCYTYDNITSAQW